MEERAQREAWLRQQPCQACWRAGQRDAAAAQRDAWKLPALEGAPDEIAWAEVIRMKAIAHNRDYHQQLLAEEPFQEDPGLHTTVITAANAALAELQGQPSAAWWVENRFEAPGYVKERIIAAISSFQNARSGQGASGANDAAAGNRL